MQATNKDILKLRARVELARRSFFDFCRLFAPDFYREDREYIKKLCHSLESFTKGDKRVLVVNMPPRHGKSRTACLLCGYLFGRDPKLKIMTASYNEVLSSMFSKNVRNEIMKEKGDALIPVYSDVFPEVKIKKGDGAMGLWSLEGGYNSYLATSPRGTATGFGADIIIIDDLIKSDFEANDARIKQEQFVWFTDTMLSRLERGGKIIVIMTRWASDDLAGKILALMPGAEHICYRACTDGKMLCPEILSLSEYRERKSLTSPEIVAANYDQEPIDRKGRLYGEIKTYSVLPFEKGEAPVFSYTDTADVGEDYLCCIVFALYGGEAYVLDVLYTKEPMEVTENMQADMLTKHRVINARIEANNGGRGFARAVDRIIRQGEGSFKGVCISTFTQKNNKATRILTCSSWVKNHIYFPEDWLSRWEEFAKSVLSFQKEGNNPHDDAEDALSGVAETVMNNFY